MKAKFVFIAALLTVCFAALATTLLVRESWVRHFSSAGDPSIDLVIAFAVDDSSNVIVSGNSRGAGTGFDFLTVKYDSLGNQKWVTRYNSAPNSDDEVADLVVDHLGNIYVVGSSDGASGMSDYVAVKYDPHGVEQWVARYDGPGHNLDEATAITVDDSGNVYVTGFSNGSGWLPYPDIVTIKYNRDGVEQWLARYDGEAHWQDVANTIAVDREGNVYVAGATGKKKSQWDFASTTDYLTIKYNANGELQWQATYDGPASGIDFATQLVIDKFNNVCVTGGSEGSGTRLDYTTIKYNSNGEEQWVARYNSSENMQDNVSDIAVDASGNIYITGTIGGDLFNPNSDFLTIKYNSAGNEQWVARYNGPGNLWERTSALAVDEDENVYVTGQSVGNGTASDYATLKYNHNGVLAWEVRYNSDTNSDDCAVDIELDRSGNIYVTGTTEISMDEGKYTTIKYTQSNIRAKSIRQLQALGNNLSLSIPNPFNASTMIIFQVHEAGPVSLKIYNMLGQHLATLVDQQLPAGNHEVIWDAGQLNSGVYFYRLQIADKIETKKLILLR